MKNIQEVVQNNILEMIVQQWQALLPKSRPWGVWVRRYPPLSLGANTLDASVVPEAVWLLENGILRERSVCEWQRFFVVQCEQPWSVRAFGHELNPLFGTRPEIGLAAFACYSGSEAYYLELVWGGCFGRGWELNASEAGQVYQSKELWIS